MNYLTLIFRSFALLLVLAWALPAAVSPGYVLTFPTYPVLALIFAPWFISVGITVVKYRWVTKWRPSLITWLLHMSKSRTGPDADLLRHEFSTLPMPKDGPHRDHTHGESASLRATAKKFMAALATSVGLKPFQIQQAKVDQKLGTDGSRTYYWSKDVTVDPNYKDPGLDHLVCMTDVDYYIDMPRHLAWYARPTLLFSFVPSNVAKATGEYSYTFDAEDYAIYTISGGGAHRHQLWNYGADNCVATWDVGGIPLITTTYVIERRNVGPDHQVILLVPTATWYGPFAWLANLLSGYRLERLHVVVGEYLRLQHKTREGLTVSTGRVMSYNSGTVSAAVDDAIASIARMMKVDITTPTVLTYLQGDVDQRPEATALCEFHRANPGHKPDTVFPVDYAVNNFSFSPERYDPAAKPSLQAFMSPLIHECYAPTNCLENDERCIQSRLTSVRSDAELPHEYMRYVDEFVALLVPVPHRAGPCDVDTVYERQCRPTQRALLDQGSWFGPVMWFKRIVGAFQKAEASTEVKDPRNISTINPRDKLDYSRYTYVAADCLKSTPWYAFCQTPLAIALRVVAICTLAVGHVINSDLSRFDGRLSYAFRTLERAFLLRLFRREYHAEVSDLHASQFNLRGYTKHGVGYETGASRLSGSPETALFNSVDNAFMVFVTLRLMGLNAATAWKRLGIYGGDDGLTADLDVEIYKRVVSSLGMKSTTEVVRKGTFGVKFLARVYGPDVWTGAPDSCCDLPRQLSKFHATAHLPPNITPEMKLIEKARGFFLSDRNTPVIGQLATRVMILTSRHVNGAWQSNVLSGDTIAHVEGRELKDIAAQSIIEQSFKVRHYAAIAPPDVQYPNDDSGWMSAYAIQAIPTLDLARFNAYLGRCDSLHKLLSPPLIASPRPIVVPAPAVVNDQFYSPPVTKSEPKEAQKALLPTPIVPPVVPPVVPQAPAQPTGSVAVQRSRSARRRANSANRKAGAQPAVAGEKTGRDSQDNRARSSNDPPRPRAPQSGSRVGAVRGARTRHKTVGAA